MSDPAILDTLFREAVAAIDAGDTAALGALLAAQPSLVRERLEAPGAWLREKVGDALDGFFRRPYLLWFVAEDPARNGTLPANIPAVTQTIIRAATRERVANLQEQLDYALRLVCWSPAARDCGVQIGLVGVLIDAGASTDGRTLYEGRFGTNTDAAIYNGNFAAAEYLLERGATLTLTTALCLERLQDAERLARSATTEEKNGAFALAAKNGKAAALRTMLALGIDPNQPLPHGTALHHAAASGILDAVKVLVQAGSDLNKRDAIYKGTPLGWATYALRSKPGTDQYGEIVAYLRKAGGEQ